MRPQQVLDLVHISMPRRSSTGRTSTNNCEVTAKLPELSQVDLAKVDTYERKNDDRTTVTEKVSALQAKEPWPGYDEQTVEEIVKALGAEGIIEYPLNKVVM